MSRAWGPAAGSATGSARRKVARGGMSIGFGGERVGLAPKRAVERVQWIVGLAEPPGEAAPLDPGQGPDGLEAEPLESPRRLGLRRRAATASGASADAESRPQIAPGLANRASAQAAAGVGAIAPRALRPSRPKLSSHVVQQPALAAEQMRDPAGVEPQPVLAIDLGQRRPAHRPAREAVERGLIAGGIGGDCNERGVEGPGIGQAHARPSAVPGGGAGRGMDNRPVSALDGQCGCSLRRCAARFRPALDRQARAARSKAPASWLRVQRPGPAAAGAEQLGIPGRRARRSGIEDIGERGRACHPPAHPRTAQIGGSAEPHQPAGDS